jgi:uncharacterized membrane protein
MFLLSIVILLSFLGFLDATYLTILHYKNIIPSCFLTGCDTVLTSKFSTIGPIPISLIGSFYYLSLLILTISHILNNRSYFLKSLFFLISFASIVSLILIFLQAFILKAFCQYCLLSEAVTFLLFVVVFLSLKSQQKTLS